MNRDQIFKEVLKNPIYENVLVKYFPGTQKRDEFRQFLWVELCQIPDEKIERIWAKNQFLWYYCGIIKFQVESSTSKWYREFVRKNTTNDTYLEAIDETPLQLEVDEQIRINNQKTNLINQAITYHLSRDPMLKTEFDLLNMKYTKGYTYREIEEQTHIPYSAVFRYVRDAKTLIKKLHNTKRKQTKMILLKCLSLAWWLANFTPLQDLLTKYVKPKMPLRLLYLNTLMSCHTCLSFWITIIWTHDIFLAAGAAMIAYTYQKIMMSLKIYL